MERCRPIIHACHRVSTSIQKCPHDSWILCLHCCQVERCYAVFVPCHGVGAGLQERFDDSWIFCPDNRKNKRRYTVFVPCHGIGAGLQKGRDDRQFYLNNRIVERRRTDLIPCHGVGARAQKDLDDCGIPCIRCRPVKRCFARVVPRRRVGAVVQTTLYVVDGGMGEEVGGAPLGAIDATLVPKCPAWRGMAQHDAAQGAQGRAAP